MPAPNTPIGLMLGLSLGVLTWQHVVGHTTTSAYTMHTPPVLLLCSISTCTAIVSYFMTMGGISLLRVLGVCAPGHRQAEQEASSCSVEYEYSFGKNGAGAAEDEVLTLSMVWSGVYGLGMATFFLGYIVTMASTLATFAFLVGLYSVSLYENVTARLYRLGQPHAQAEQAKTRFDALVLVVGIMCMAFMGVHTASMDMNVAGRISVADVFMGVIFPSATPWLLKGISKRRTKSVPVLATWEVSLPFTMVMSILFIASMAGSGAVPYQVRSHIARNIAAATTLMPLAWGLTMVCILHSTFENNTLSVFATFMTVASGRELTLYNSSAVVWCMFITSLCMFGIVLLSSSKQVLASVESVAISPSILMAQRVTSTLQEKEGLAPSSA